MNMQDLEVGNSYACRFRIKTLLDTQGRPWNPLDNTQTAQGEGDYTSLGVIKIRDLEQQLVELEDTASGASFVVAWDDCWDIDTVEWKEPLEP